MKSLLAIFTGGPHDGRESRLRPCDLVTFGEHSKIGSVFHLYRYACVDAATGKSVFVYAGLRELPKPRGLRKIGLRLGLLTPLEVTA